jgi:two-component system sensor histidine kinase BarA
VSFVKNLKQAFDASRQRLVSWEDVERGTRRRMFLALVAIDTVLLLGFTVFQLHRGLYSLALVSGSAIVFSMACLIYAVRVGRYEQPFRAFVIFMFACLSVVTLRQGPDLPAAGWWLSTLPFILASAGFHYLAIGSAVAFLAIVSSMFFGLTTSMEVPSDMVLAPIRHYIAIVGSQLVAMWLIIMAMRSRAEVTNALEVARAEAAEAAEIKSRFLANMSHEIRTPLTGIIGTAEVLDSNDLSPAQRVQILALQRQSAMTLLALVNDVLDFAKLGDGKVTLEERPVYLRGVVIEANELFSMQAFGKGIELSSSCNPDVPQSFLGDAVRLRQIVNNLVGNAVKVTAKGGVHIHLSIDPADEQRNTPIEGKRWVRVEVVDSGCGVTEEELPTLFNAFVQADASVTRRFGGTGLGLSIAQELVKLMGGRIDVRSSAGQGSCFAVVVPLSVDSKEVVFTPSARRTDVVLAVTNRGLDRHLKSLLYELRVEPITVDRLPTARELELCSLLIVDAPLLALPDASKWLAEQANAKRRIAVLTPLGSDAVVGLPRDAVLIYKPVRKHALEAILSSAGALTSIASGAPVSRRAAFEGLHVLLVEDNPVNQVVVQAMLAELGATSTVAGNGREALECVAGEPFDLVLMDVHMPELDGLSATRALRAREAATGARRLVVVAMTATAESEDGPVCEGAGMDAFLSKPFGLSDLRRCLQRFAATVAVDVETCSFEDSRSGR